MTNPEQMAMVERIARAICRAYSPGKKGWHSLTEEEQGWEVDNGWDLWVAEARAALSALREPTEGMIRAGETVVDNQFDPWDPGKFLGVDDAWRAMVDAALTEGKDRADG